MKLVGDVLIHFPNRNSWHGEDKWIRPSQVAALQKDSQWVDLVFTEVVLVGGGTIYLSEYGIPEVAKMLGLSRKMKCPHGHHGVRCDDCYADGLSRKAIEGSRRRRAAWSERRKPGHESDAPNPQTGNPMNKAAIGIVEKLHETHFIALYGDPHGSEQLVNPDGPEAAAIIMEMVEALEDIADPMRALKREADASGNKLSGTAYQIANDPFFIKSLAQAALAKVRYK